MSGRSLGRLGPATAVATLAIAVTTVFCAAVAAAGPIGVHLRLGSGSLSVSATGARVATAGPTRVPLTIVDARGTGAGWTLRMASSAPVVVSRVSVACGPHSTCTLPRPTRVASGDIVLRAASGSGLGVMRLVVAIEPGARQRRVGAPARVSFSIS